jgi:NAD(P)-dependent dehydrogenase (short-subunit alcohol dehydrogenase family)
MARPTTPPDGRRRILVTGASSGLGEAMAHRWAAHGHDLALLARRADTLDAVAASLVGDGRFVTVPVDVTDPDAVPLAFQQACDELDGLDRVVVNAGIGKGAPVGSGRPDANRATLLANAVGAFEQAEAAMAVFREQGHGHLVLVGSVAGVTGLPGSTAAYSASKAAVRSLGRSLRAELAAAGSGIRVTTVLPGYIRTPLNEGHARPFSVSLDRGVDALVAAIEREPAEAFVPRLPWAVIGRVLPVVPDKVLGRRLRG